MVNQTKERKRSRQILDTDTGEIIAEEKSGDRIKYISANSMKSFEKVKEAQLVAKMKAMREDELQLWDVDSFYKGNVQEIRKTMDKLDIYEKAFLYSIATYIGYEDCCLRFDNGNELTFEKMVEISGISKGKLSTVLQGLIKKDILYKGKNSKTVQYFVNPWLFCKGNRINKVLKRMFRNYEIQSENGTKWKDFKR